MNYNINISTMCEMLIPRVLRKPRIKAFIKSIIAPIQTLNDQFNTWSLSVRRKLSYNSQVIYLEKLLNDIFDNTSRRIYVQTTNQSIDLELYNTEEGIVKQYISNASESSESIYIFNNDEVISYDFIVYIPLDIITQSTRVSGFVNSLKLAGIRFEIQII